ncbi:unnamed protein product, partial [Staurois parvus]
HLAQCSQASTVLATAKPRHIHRIARKRSVICYAREHISTSRVQGVNPLELKWLK